jgi:hypothetical protein
LLVLVDAGAALHQTSPREARLSAIDSREAPPRSAPTTVSCVDFARGPLLVLVLTTPVQPPCSTPPPLPLPPPCVGGAVGGAGKAAFLQLPPGETALKSEISGRFHAEVVFATHLVGLHQKQIPKLHKNPYRTHLKILSV